jgi:hypothetical protein
MKHNNSKLFILLCLFALIPNIVVAGDFLISKKDFKAKVTCIKVFPVEDSMRVNCIRLMENIEYSVKLNPSDTAGSERMAKIIELSKASAMAPYYIAFKTLKLDNPKARDTVLLTLNMKILEELIKSGNYKITTAGNVNDTINNIDSSAVILKSYLKIIPKTVERNRSGGRSQIHTSAIVLDAWVNSNDGTLLWHKQGELYYYMVEEPMAKIFTNKAIEELVNETYNSLMK